MKVSISTAVLVVTATTTLGFNNNNCYGNNGFRGPPFATERQKRRVDRAFDSLEQEIRDRRQQGTFRRQDGEEMIKKQKEWVNKAFDFAKELNQDFSSTDKEAKRNEEDLEQVREWINRAYGVGFENKNMGVDDNGSTLNSQESKTLQENLVDTELIYSYAKTNNLTELEVFVSGPNVANIQSIGDRCFSEGLYQAAKILYININNNSKLALCHIHLEEYREAVQAATKANNVSTWKQVCFACLRAEEFRLASTCGLEVIKYPDHVDEVVTYYSDLGHFTHVVSLFEQGIGLEDAHIGIFTELGVLYTKHVPEKVTEHCKVFFSKLNVSKVVRACERARLYQPAVYLYMQDKQHDSAVKIMMDRAPAWDNDLFLDSITKVRNQENMYKGVGYYLTTHPKLFTRLMEVLEEHVDHSRVVSQLRRTGDWALQLGQPYLKSVQKNNLSPVNEALNELYVEEEDYEGLRKSIDGFNNFNMIGLASKLATHELLEFRRISAYVYRCNKKWTSSIELSKSDKMWKDCIDTANESTDGEIIENLLRFFCETSEKECFCAALYTCFQHVSPDVALELAWLNGYHNFVMPFFIQTFRHTHERLETLENRTAPPAEDDNAPDSVAATYGNLGGFGSGMLMIENGGGIPMPTPGPPAGMTGGIDMSSFGVPAQPQMAGMQPGMPGMMPNGMPPMGM